MPQIGRGFSLGILGALALGWLGLQGSAAAVFSTDLGVDFPAQGVAAVIPDVAVIDAIDDLIEDLVESLDEAHQVATAHEGPLTGLEQQALVARLDKAEALIDRVFNPTVEPNLTPIDAGGISLLYTPLTLADYAEQCLELAHDAREELRINGDLFDDQLIGTKLKTIRYLISRSLPHNYRSKAGVNSAQADLP